MCEEKLTLQPTASRPWSKTMAVTVANAVSFVSSRTMGQNVMTSKEPEIAVATTINSH